MSWANSGLTPNQIGLVQRGDKAQHAARRGKEDVAARLVGLGFEHEGVVVALRLAVVGQKVEAVAEPGKRIQELAARVHLGALAPAPEVVDFRAELMTQVHAQHGFLQRVGADAGVGGGKGPVFERRIGKQVGGRHRHLEARVRERGLELRNDPVAFGGTGVNRHQIVVVKVDAVCAEFGELLDDVGSAKRFAGGFAERIAANVANGPEAKGELVCGGGG